MSDPSGDRLPLSRILLYSLPFSGYLAMSMPVGMWFAKFSTDQLLIAPGIIGAIVFLARAWDAVSDPMAGYLSDRTNSRLGRRRSWLVASAIPVGLTYVMLWTPPESLGTTGVIVWIAAAMLLWETTSTAFYVPYLSLGLELTTDYHDRTRLFGWRQALVAAGFGASLGALSFMQNEAEYPDAEFQVAVVTSVALTLLILICVLGVPEPKHHQGRGSDRLWNAFADVLRNPHARILLVVLGIDSFGMGAISGLGAYMAEDVVGRGDMLIPMMSVWMVPQFVCVPIWVRLSRRIGKKRLWLAGMVCSITGFLGILSVGEGDWLVTLVQVLLIGVGTSISLVIGPSVQADVVDYDELQTGERKEGAYVAVWNFMRKAGAALSMSLGLFVIGLTGYDPLADRQSDLVVSSIRAMAGVVPALAFTVGALVFARFGLSEAEHRRVRAEIAARD